MRQRGFTLIELTLVTAIVGVMAASLTIFLKPAIDSYFAQRRRAELTDMADTALRRIGRDIRRAVPNSIRPGSPSCIELVPTIAGGRYRLSADAGTGGLALDTSTPTASFDVLSPMTTMTAPVAADWVVVDNQNGDEVYAGSNRAQLSAAPGTPATTAGLSRITLGAATQFPAGYDGGRFVVVSNTEQAVVYTCSGGTLFRKVVAFGADLATACASVDGAIAATNVASCAFTYDPNQGATQQSGFVWMRLELSQSGESVVLGHGVHVDNSP